MKDIKFKLAGLTCEACVKLATSRLNKVPGVHDVSVDLTSGDVRVTGEESLDEGILSESLAGTHYSIVKK